jgi:hypothetical protein
MTCFFADTTNWTLQGGPREGKERKKVEESGSCCDYRDQGVRIGASLHWIWGITGGICQTGPATGFYLDELRQIKLEWAREGERKRERERESERGSDVQICSFTVFEIEEYKEGVVRNNRPSPHMLRDVSNWKGNVTQGLESEIFALESQFLINTRDSPYTQGFMKTLA